MRAIFCTILLLFVLQTQFAYGSDRAKFIWVEPGDSYIALFGKSWLPVFQANNRLKFLDDTGKLNNNPEKLVIGSKLIIPAGTVLTERAIKRMNKYEAFIKEAEQALHEAETIAALMGECSSEACRQGMILLEQAQKNTKDMTYGYANFLEATKLGRDALNRFKVAQQLQKTKIDLINLNKQLAAEKITIREAQNKQKMQRILMAGVIVLLVFSSILLSPKRLLTKA